LPAINRLRFEGRYYTTLAGWTIPQAELVLADQFPSLGICMVR
jgi:hypothetical protein